MGLLKLADPSSLRISLYQIPEFGLIPNTSIQQQPLRILHSCLPPSATASRIESHLSSVGVVMPQWRYTMYSTTHFHSTTHEVLCVGAGRAKLCFGGKENPKRVECEVEKGDVIVIPAGVGHRLLDDYDGTFEMVGSYPVGKSWDMCYGKEGEEARVEGIRNLPWFENDPLYGNNGPIMQRGS